VGTFLGGPFRDLVGPPSETAYRAVNTPEVSLIRQRPAFSPFWQGVALIAENRKEQNRARGGKLIVGSEAGSAS
jgi:hypothetical protein